MSVFFCLLKSQQLHQMFWDSFLAQNTQLSFSQIWNQQRHIWFCSLRLLKCTERPYMFSVQGVSL